MADVKSSTDFASDSQMLLELPKYSHDRSPIPRQERASGLSQNSKGRIQTRSRLYERNSSALSGAEKVGMTELRDDQGSGVRIEEFSVKQSRQSNIKERERNIYTVQSLNSAAMSAATYTYQEVLQQQETTPPPDSPGMQFIQQKTRSRPMSGKPKVTDYTGVKIPSALKLE